MWRESKSIIGFVIDRKYSFAPLCFRLVATGAILNGQSMLLRTYSVGVVGISRRIVSKCFNSMLALFRHELCRGMLIAASSALPRFCSKRYALISDYRAILCSSAASSLISSFHEPFRISSHHLARFASIFLHSDLGA